MTDDEPRETGRQLPRRTTALPGTPEKVEVLRARFARGELLWHPLDARWNGEGAVQTQADKRKVA